MGDAVHALLAVTGFAAAVSPFGLHLGHAEYVNRFLLLGGDHFTIPMVATITTTRISPTSHRFQDKVLPLLLQYNAPDVFSYRSCAFKVQKSKAGTGRVVGFRELGLANRWESVKFAKIAFCVRCMCDGV